MQLPIGGIESKDRRRIRGNLPAGIVGILEGLLPSVAVKGRLIGLDGLIVVVINRHPEFVLDLGGLSADLAVDINIAVNYFYGFAGSAHESFYVIDRRVGRVLENDDVPLLRFEKLVDAFEDKYSVAV